MHAISGVDKPRSVAVQCCVRHQAQINKQTKLNARVVNPVWGAVCDVRFGVVWVDVSFCVSGACYVRLHGEQEDGL